MYIRCKNVRKAKGCPLNIEQYLYVGGGIKNLKKSFCLYFWLSYVQ